VLCPWHCSISNQGFRGTERKSVIPYGSMNAHNLFRTVP
jgi:hypothetical protein